MFWVLLKRELTLNWRNKNHFMLVVTLCLLTALLFILAIGPDPQLLSKVGISVIWVVLIFSSLLSTPSVWSQDHLDGTLQHIKSSSCSLEYYVLAKVVAQWLLLVGALGLILPILIYGLTQSLLALPSVGLCFALVSLPISFLTVTGATLTMGQDKPGLLAPTILAPFYLPLLIFSTSAQNALTGSTSFYLMVLAGICLFMSPLLLYINVFTLKWSEL